MTFSFSQRHDYLRREAHLSGFHGDPGAGASGYSPKSTLRVPEQLRGPDQIRCSPNRRSIRLHGTNLAGLH